MLSSRLLHGLEIGHKLPENDVGELPLETPHEAAQAMKCFTRLAPLVPGAQGVIYDTALRGIHHQKLLRELGLLPVNKVTAAEAGAKKPRRTEGRRIEKSVHFEARGGAVGIAEPTDR